MKTYTTLVQELTTHQDRTQSDHELAAHIHDGWVCDHIAVIAATEQEEFGDQDQFTRTYTAIYRTVLLWK
jgi:hypothetical protein